MSRLPRTLIAAFASFALAVSLALSVYPTPYRKGLIVTIGFGLFALLAVRHQTKRFGDRARASPLSIYATSWFFYFGVLGLSNFSQAGTDRRLGFDPDAILKGMVVALVSLALVTAGYLLVTNREIQRGDDRASLQHLNFSFVLLCLGIGWACRAALFSTAQFGYLQFGDSSTGPAKAILLFGDSLLSLGLAALAYALWAPQSPEGDRRRARLVLLAGLLPLTLTAVTSGQKGRLILDLMPVAVVFLLTRGRVPWKFLLLAVLYLTVIYSGAEKYRQDIAGGVLTVEDRRDPVKATAQVATRIGQEWSRHGVIHHFHALSTHFQGEYAVIVRNLSIILHKTPDEIPYFGTRHLALSPFFFLPNEVRGPGANLGLYVQVTYHEGPATSSTPPTQPGDLFMSGGWPVLVLGEFAVGLVLGLLWRFQGNSNSPRRTVLYAVIAGLLVNAGLDLGTLVRASLQFTVVLAVVVRWLFVFPATVPVRGLDSADAQLSNGIGIRGR